MIHASEEQNDKIPADLMTLLWLPPFRPTPQLDMHHKSIIVLLLFTFVSNVFATGCADWATSVTQKWRSYFLDENDFPEYKTWEDINISGQDDGGVRVDPFAEPIPDKFKRPTGGAGLEDTLKEMREEMLSYKVETTERLDEMHNMVRETLDERVCQVLWRMYEEEEPGPLKHRIAANYLDKCKDSLHRQAQ